MTRELLNLLNKYNLEIKKISTSCDVSTQDLLLHLQFTTKKLLINLKKYVQSN